MKTRVRIDGIFRKRVGDALFDRLAGIVPEAITGSQMHAFDMSLMEDEPRVQLVLDALICSGYKLWKDHSLDKRDDEFNIGYTHVFDANDLDPSPILELKVPPEHKFLRVQRERDGFLVIFEEDPPVEAAAFHSGLGFWTFMPKAVGDLLTGAAMRGLALRRTSVVTMDIYQGRVRGTVADVSPYLEMHSEIRMPPFSPSLPFITMKFEPIPHGSEGPGIRREGLFTNPITRYRRSDLAKMPPFDVARTHERIASSGWEFDRPLIVSQRFRRFCIEHNLKADFAPVVIDPD